MSFTVSSSLDLLLTLSLPLSTGVLGSLAMEALLRPGLQPAWQRSTAANGVHLGSWLLLMGVLTLILQRPWFAMVVVLSLQLVVIQSSNTKSRTLNEPFICHDFEYFWDALRHPRLYVPFFGVGLALAASSAGIVAIGSFFSLEPSLITRSGVAAFLLSSATLTVAGALLVKWGVSRLAPIALIPARDLYTMGLYASLWAYGVALLRSPPPAPDASPFSGIAKRDTTGKTQAERPNVVLVQSESFCDPRHWCNEVNPHLLHHFDSTRAQALEHGTLHVPAWGANTVRTECAVLTGLAPERWGARQFNPYRTLARHPLPSVAQAFQARGYRTVCIHPYPATFYMRHRVMPLLGFETFIDIQAFDEKDRHGQYIGDHAVAQKVGHLLEDDDNRPLFVFVITMENHGPLHLEAPAQADLPDTLPNVPWPLPGHLRDLAVYLHHLGEADQMLARIKTALALTDRPGLLGWYGDHVPILPEAYAHFSPPAGSTPYVIWSTHGHRRSYGHSPARCKPQHIAANALGVRLFNHAFGHDISNDVIKAEPEPQEQE